MGTAMRSAASKCRRSCASRRSSFWASATPRRCCWATCADVDVDSLAGRPTLIYWNDVFEHIPPDEIGDYLSHIHRLLAPGGTLVTITPHWLLRPMDVTGDFCPPRTVARGLHLKEYRLAEVTRPAAASRFPPRGDAAGGDAPAIGDVRRRRTHGEAVDRTMARPLAGAGGPPVVPRIGDERDDRDEVRDVYSCDDGLKPAAQARDVVTPLPLLALRAPIKCGRTGPNESHNRITDRARSALAARYAGCERGHLAVGQPCAAERRLRPGRVVLPLADAGRAGHLGDGLQLLAAGGAGGRAGAARLVRAILGALSSARPAAHVSAPGDDLDGIADVCRGRAVGPRRAAVFGLDFRPVRPSSDGPACWRRAWWR